MRNGPDPDKEEPGTRAAFLSLLFGMPPAARKAPALAPANDQRPVNARGQEYEAERLTGSSATVERLFSQVGIAFSKLRKNAEPSTIADILFTKLNGP